MTDLRTSIAKALYGQILHPVPLFDDQPDDVQAAFDADAVIRELGLTRESAQDGIAPVDDPPVGQHRYVTEWSEG